MVLMVRGIETQGIVILQRDWSTLQEDAEREGLPWLTSFLAALHMYVTEPLKTAANVAELKASLEIDIDALESMDGSPPPHAQQRLDSLRRAASQCHGIIEILQMAEPQEEVRFVPSDADDASDLAEAFQAYKLHVAATPHAHMQVVRALHGAASKVIRIRRRYESSL